MVDDPLFVRGSTGFTPTTRADGIWPGVREGLVRLRDPLSPPSFDLGRSTRRFTIATASYFPDLFIPRVVEQLQRDAPGVSLRIIRSPTYC
jgi:DNA-binding transcriptional LysR family regulator